jgi:hypothetical protein
MPKTWKQLFADKEIADTTEITIGNDKVTLGELRSFDAEQQGKVAQELQRATQMQQALEADQVKAATLLAELATVPRPAAPAAPAATPTEPDYLSDPILRPLYQKIDALAIENKSLKESITGELSGLKSQIQTAASSYINDGWESSFRNLRETADPVIKPIIEKIDLRTALKYAGDHGIVDHRKVPDPVRAALQMTEKERIEAIRSAEREAGKKEGIELGRKQLAAEMPKPGVTGRRVVETPHKNMDEAVAALANDPDIQQSLAQIQRVQ